LPARSSDSERELAATITGDTDDAGAAPIEVATSFERRFDVHAELARGGMGRVAVATDNTLRREVAIKELIETADAGLVRRFEREALITARLQHPGVVGVYDFTRRESGVAALIMRRVRGRPFDQALREALTLERRLELLAPFISACDAVAYAHSEGVIHRDLKPANVLLGDFGDTVVIDWGLAKDLRAHTTSDSIRDLSGFVAAVTSEATLTMAGSVMGTPAYMSPEQARGELVDERGDVYALGAMLYQLVCGVEPYGKMESAALLQAVVRGAPPPLASREPRVQPELVTLVERAMARDSAHRYANAGELAAELKRFQTGQLLSSHRYSARALISRWARKHAAALTVSAVALVVLTVFGAITARDMVAQRDRAHAEAEKARAAAASAQRIADFMVNIFKVADPTEGKGNEVTARAVLDRAAKQIGDGLAGDELVKARMMAAMGNAYSGLGLYQPAHELVDGAWALRKRLLGPEAPETLASGTDVANSLYFLEQYAQAEAVARETLSAAERTLGKDADVTLAAQLLLGNILFYAGHMQDAEAISQANLALAVRRFGEQSPRTIGARNLLANAVSRRGQYKKAVELRKQDLAIVSATKPFDEVRYHKCQADLAVEYAQLGDFAAAEALQREVLAALSRRLGPTHPTTLYHQLNLATTWSREGQHAKGEASLLALVEVMRKQLGPKSWGVKQGLYALACVYAADKRDADAIQSLEKFVEIGASPDLDMAHDPDLASLHGKPAFEALLARLPAPPR
jgi:tRNA A-37 threonylcarbamoyl transferase component Bud32